MEGEDDVAPLGERVRRAPRWMEDYVSGAGLSDKSNLACFMVHDDLICFDEAVKMKKWRKLMDLEMEAIEKNKTWELVSLPKKMKKIIVKWVFRMKLNEKGEVDKCKACLVVKGYAQRYEINYNEVFALVACWDTIRLILALAAHKGWIVFQLDVKSAFLLEELKEAVYVEQLEGHICKGEEHKVLKLKKALYGLKQAPRA